MVKFTKFIEEASVDQKKFYVDEIFSRKFINNPRVAIRIIADLRQQEVISSDQFMAYAKKIKEMNESYLTPENFAKHKESHKDGYQALDFINPL